MTMFLRRRRSRLTVAATAARQTTPGGLSHRGRPNLGFNAQACLVFTSFCIVASCKKSRSSTHGHCRACRLHDSSPSGMAAGSQLNGLPLHFSAGWTAERGYCTSGPSAFSQPSAQWQLPLESYPTSCTAPSRKGFGFGVWKNLPRNSMQY
jgi:hypothetical protein